jgi:hypothetical protein
MATTRRDARDAALLAIGTALARKEVDLLKLEREIGRLKAERLRLSDERNPVMQPGLQVTRTPISAPPEPAPHTYTAPPAAPKQFTARALAYREQRQVEHRAITMSDLEGTARKAALDAHRATYNDMLANETED